MKDLTGAEQQTGATPDLKTYRPLETNKDGEGRECTAAWDENINNTGQQQYGAATIRGNSSAPAPYQQ
jgi:hypothetical protein